ncbi:Protein CBG22985 [Caenorhabditis briggsae]|uniref:Protein CBG22985 n=1 Tax=Caenorhabditis briggsae TaxID=6238 RepID=A8Y3I3_CAEBR|nr:Protein CBG22985 [Caenorhabditis briggsae]CAP39452.1 Protein CBG22985 [Caenorhabditis briggsae]
MSKNSLKIKQHFSASLHSGCLSPGALPDLWRETGYYNHNLKRNRLRRRFSISDATRRFANGFRRREDLNSRQSRSEYTDVFRGNQEVEIELLDDVEVMEDVQILEENVEETQFPDDLQFEEPLFFEEIEEPLQIPDSEIQRIDANDIIEDSFLSIINDDKFSINEFDQYLNVSPHLLRGRLPTWYYSRKFTIKIPPPLWCRQTKLLERYGFGSFNILKVHLRLVKNISKLCHNVKNYKKL